MTAIELGKLLISAVNNQPEISFYDLSEASKAMKVASETTINQLARRSLDQQKASYEDRYRRNLIGEACELVVYKLLEAIKPESSILVQNQETEARGEFWWDLKLDDIKIEVKCVRKGSYVSWSDQSKVQTLINHENNVDLVVFCNADQGLNVKVIAAMIGQKFSSYLLESRIEASGVYLDHRSAQRADILWTIEKTLKDF